MNGDPARNSSTGSGVFWTGVSVVALGALALRAVHLGWGLPEVFEEATPVRKAIEFWGTAGRGIDLNPHFFKYPTLTFYVNFLAQCVWYFWLSISGMVSSWNGFREVLAQDPAHAILIGRGLQAVVGALVVYPTAALGRRLSGDGAGWMAAAVVAALPVAVRESQVVTPDMFLALFCALGLVSAVAMAQRGNRSDYLWAGVWLGLATAAKYPGAFLAVALVTAHARRAARAESGPAGIAFSSYLWQALFLAAVVFFAASPYVILDARAAFRDIAFERWHMATGHLGREEGRAWMYYLSQAVPRGWTSVVALVAAVGGVLLLARRRSRPGTLPTTVFALVFLGVVGSWKMAASRYLLPLVPVTAAWAGAAAIALPRALPNGLRTPTTGFLALLLIGWPVVRSVDEVALRGREDSRVAADAWIARNVPAGSTLLVERYGPHPDAAKYNVLYLPFHGVQPHLYDPAYSAPLYASFDFVVFSSQVSSRYLADPTEYPAQCMFYRIMESAFDEVAAFRAGEYLGPSIRILKRKTASPLKDLSHIPPGFFRALQGSRPLAEYFSALGTVLVRQGRSDLGFSMLRHAVDMDRTDAKVWGNLGAMHLRQGRFQESLSEFREAERLGPDDSKVAYDLATLHERMGEPGEAADKYRRVLELDPGMEEAYLGLARVLVQDMRYPEARVVLREFLHRFPRSKRRTKAEAALKELRMMGPGRP